MDPNATWQMFTDALDECERLLALRNDSDEWDPELDKELRIQFSQAQEALITYNRWLSNGGFEADCVTDAARDRFGEISMIVDMIEGM